MYDLDLQVSIGNFQKYMYEVLLKKIILDRKLNN